MDRRGDGADDERGQQDGHTVAIRCNNDCGDHAGKEVPSRSRQGRACVIRRVQQKSNPLCKQEGGKHGNKI